MSHDHLPLKPPAGDFEAYIFDCDGTLAATMRLHHRSWARAVGMQIGREFDFPWPLFCSMGGMSTADTCRRLEADFGISLDPHRIVHDAEAYLDEHLDSVEPIDDVVTLARHAKTLGIGVAVASGGYGPHVRRTLKAIGLEGFFPVIATVEEVAFSKPAPDLFLLAAERLGVNPARCLVIEDSPRGREAAEAAGMACLMVEPR
jgi:HAD superfamily hydrolase (TIGR01509 family)